MGNFAASATTSSLQDRLQRAHRTGVLTLCSLGLQGLPKNVGQELSDPLSTLAPLIRSLDLSRNKITAMPAELQQLTQLKILNLAHNKLKFIDSECQLCHKLEILDLRENGLTSIPPILLLNLTNVRSLHLSRNFLTQLPVALFQLHSLVVLDLSYNCLRSIDPTAADSDSDSDRVDNRHWTRLSKLEQLNVEHNQLDLVPVELVDMASLTQLNLAHNRLETIPQQLFANKRLKTISIDGNPLTQSKFMNIDGYKEYEQRHKERADQLLKLNN